MRWRAGASSAAHDHGEARGRVFVVAGTVEEEVVTVCAQGLASSGRRRASAPAILEVERGVVHVMHALDEAITVHVYEPPVSGMRVWDEDNRQVLVVDDEHGAWLPAPDRVIARAAWGLPVTGDRLP